MWNVARLSNSRHAIKALDEIRANNCGSMSGIELAVYDLGEKRIAMACGGPDHAQRLSLNGSELNAVDSLSKGRYVLLAYDNNNQTVAVLDSVDELGAVCAILVTVTSVLMGGTCLQGRPAPARGGFRQSRRTEGYDERPCDGFKTDPENFEVPLFKLNSF